MKVYIVVREYPYEGYDEPEAVFASREKAEAYILADDISGRPSREHIEIVELEVRE